MLLFGHAAITIAIAKGIEHRIRRDRRYKSIKIDHAVVIFSALLPDIIDKSLVGFVDGLSRFGGHFIAHSYWFGATVTVIGILIFLINRHLDILIFGFGSLLHAFMDAMIPILNAPVNQYLGESFSLYPRWLKLVDEVMTPVYHKLPYFKGVLVYLFTPTVLVFEIIGLTILAYYTWVSLSSKGWKLH